MCVSLKDSSVQHALSHKHESAVTSITLFSLDSITFIISTDSDGTTMLCSLGDQPWTLQPLRKFLGGNRIDSDEPQRRHAVHLTGDGALIAICGNKTLVFRLTASKALTELDTIDECAQHVLLTQTNLVGSLFLVPPFALNCSPPPHSSFI